MRVWIPILISILAAPLAGRAQVSPPGAGSAPKSPLEWVRESIDYHAKPGDTEARFAFAVTNVSDANILIENVTTSCGCTVASLPSKPWTLLPHEGGEIDIHVDLRGKRGILQKTAVVYGSFGNKILNIKVTIPDPPTLSQQVGDKRAMNIVAAQTDRQAVFKGDCAECHSKPSRGLTGEALYKAACAICHDSAHRASMVPDLALLNKPVTREYWRSWISYGRVGSLMPAFREADGGPLSTDQINSLADYLVVRFPLQRNSVSRNFKVE